MDDSSRNGWHGLVDARGRPLTHPQRGYNDGFALPHTLQLGAIISGAQRTELHDRWDEARKNSKEDALAMEKDGDLWAVVNERKLATASLNWHVEVDDEKDPYQKALKDGLQVVHRATPWLLRMHNEALDATFFGRNAVQLAYEWRELQLPQVNFQPATLGAPAVATVRPAPQRALVVAKHQPVHGDSLGWMQNGTPYVLINSSEGDRLRDAETIMTLGGAPGLVLKGTWRERFIIHTHEATPAEFYDVERSSAIYGTGIRDKIYWLWWLKKEFLEWITTYMERFGLGVRLWYYEAGNDVSKQEVAEIARKQDRRVNILVPLYGGKTGAAGVGGVEQIDTPIAGADALKGLMQYFDDRIERFIVGQTLSSGTEGSGLGGSGVAGLHAATKYNIIKYDAENLGDTYTEDWVKVAKWWTFPAMRGVPARWKFNVPDPDAANKLAGVQAAIAFGVDFKKDEVRGLTGMSDPQPGDDVVGGMAMLPTGPGAPGAPGQEDDDEDQEQDPNEPTPEEQEAMADVGDVEPQRNARGEPLRYAVNPGGLRPGQHIEDPGMPHEPDEQPHLGDYLYHRFAHLYGHEDAVSPATGFVLPDGRPVRMGPGKRFEDHRDALPSREAMARWGWPATALDAHDKGTRGPALQELMRRSGALRVHHEKNLFAFHAEAPLTHRQRQAVLDHVATHKPASVVADVGADFHEFRSPEELADHFAAGRPFRPSTSGRIADRYERPAAPLRYALAAGAAPGAPAAPKGPRMSREGQEPLHAKPVPHELPRVPGQMAMLHPQVAEQIRQHVGQHLPPVKVPDQNADIAHKTRVVMPGGREILARHTPSEWEELTLDSTNSPTASRPYSGHTPENYLTREEYDAKYGDAQPGSLTSDQRSNIVGPSSRFVAPAGGLDTGFDARTGLANPPKLLTASRSEAGAMAGSLSIPQQTTVDVTDPKTGQRVRKPIVLKGYEEPNEDAAKLLHDLDTVPGLAGWFGGSLARGATHPEEVGGNLKRLAALAKAGNPHLLQHLGSMEPDEVLAAHEKSRGALPEIPAGDKFFANMEPPAGRESLGRMKQLEIPLPKEKYPVPPEPGSWAMFAHRDSGEHKLPARVMHVEDAGDKWTAAVDLDHDATGYKKELGEAYRWGHDGKMGQFAAHDAFVAQMSPQQSAHFDKGIEDRANLRPYGASAPLLALPTHQDADPYGQPHPLTGVPEPTNPAFEHWYANHEHGLANRLENAVPDDMASGALTQMRRHVAEKMFPAWAARSKDPAASFDRFAKGYAAEHFPADEDPAESLHRYFGHLNDGDAHWTELLPPGMRDELLQHEAMAARLRGADLSDAGQNAADYSQRDVEREKARRQKLGLPLNPNPAPAKPAAPPQAAPATTLLGRMAEAAKKLFSREGEPARYAADKGRWITIGGSKGEGGKRRGGSPVFIVNGRITKGAPSLAGKKIDALKEDASDDPATHRQQMNREKAYQRASFAKQARKAGVKPEHLHQLAADLLAHDRELKGGVSSMLRHARQMLAAGGYHAGALAMNVGSGRVEDAASVKGLDEAGASMAAQYPELFAGHGDPAERLFDLLGAGNPDPMSEADAYEQAMEQLAASLSAHGGDDTGADTSFDFGGNTPDNDGPDDALRDIPVGELRRVDGFAVRRTGDDTYRIDKEGGKGHVSGDAATVREYIDRELKGQKAYGRALPEALERADAFSEPSFLDAKGTEAAAKAFAALPQGTAVVSLDRDAGSYGRAGRIVKDDAGKNRVVLDGEDGFASSFVEPLDADLSWRLGGDELARRRDSREAAPKQQSMYEPVPFRRPDEPARYEGGKTRREDAPPAE